MRLEHEKIQKRISSQGYEAKYPTSPMAKVCGARVPVEMAGTSCIMHMGELFSLSTTDESKPASRSEPFRGQPRSHQWL